MTAPHMEATHRIPRYNAALMAKDVALAVSQGFMSETMADRVMAKAKAQDGEPIKYPACDICGARVMENLKSGRLDMVHDYARHHMNPSQQMSGAADQVERARAESLRRAQRDLDE